MRGPGAGAVAYQRPAGHVDSDNVSVFPVPVAEGSPGVAAGAGARFKRDTIEHHVSTEGVDAPKVSGDTSRTRNAIRATHTQTRAKHGCHFPGEALNRIVEARN